MTPNQLAQTMLEARSHQCGHEGRLDEAAVKALFADSWNNDFKLEVISTSCPPAVRDILMRRVKELQPWWKRLF
jgi:hypothetical protein